MSSGIARAFDHFAGWCKRPAPDRHAYAIAALVGLVVNLLVFGVGHLLGTSSYWDLPREDSRTYLMGYRYFLHEPWHWPPFVVHDMNVPYTKNIVFTDSIPLWAAVNKAIATVLPPWGKFSERSYLGLWHALVYILQACLGVANLRALGKKTYANALLTALFFLAIPAFVFRYGHASLSAHFLTLWALYLYLRTPARAAGSTKLQLAFVIQLAVAALINPYHVAMSFALFVASLVRTRHLRTILIWLPLGLASVGLAAGLAGFFSQEAKVPMGGFDSASANLLAPFIPRRSTIFGDARWIANVEGTDYQYEGYDYLGLGLLVVLGLFVPHIRTALAVIKRHPFLFAVAFGVWLFSLSNHIYFGSHRIISYEFPAKLRWVMEQYRSPGRFIWLPTYVLVVFLLRWAIDRFNRGWQLLVVPALAVMQLLDGGLGDWRYVGDYTSKTFPHLLDLDPWRTLIHAHDRIEVHPPYDCILDGTPFVDRVSQEIEFLASERTLPINGVYSARPTRDCVAEARMREQLTPGERTLYVILPRAAPVATRLEALGATCGAFNWGLACSKLTPAVEAARQSGVLRAASPASPLSFGDTIFLGQTGNAAFVVGGWSWGEPTGRWSNQETASLVFRLDGEVPAQVRLKIEASVVLCGERLASDVDVLLDAKLLSTLHFAEGMNDATVPRSIALTHGSLVAHKANLLELRAHDMRSPRELGCAADDRKLGVWVRSLWFEPGD